MYMFNKKRWTQYRGCSFHPPVPKLHFFIKSSKLRPFTFLSVLCYEFFHELGSGCITVGQDGISHLTDLFSNLWEEIHRLEPDCKTFGMRTLNCPKSKTKFGDEISPEIFLADQNE